MSRMYGNTGDFVSFSISSALSTISGNCPVVSSALEYKYDGMRVQIHKKGKEVKIFSRGTEETTGQFPDIV